MFTFIRRIVTSRRFFHGLVKSVNIILISSLILTSCVPAKNNTQPQPAKAPSTLPVQPTETPQTNEYVPPVYTHPNPRIAVNYNVNTANTLSTSIADLTKVNDEKNIKLIDKAESDAETNFQSAKNEADKSFAKIDQQIKELTPLPNPVRKITKDQQPNTRFQNKTDSDYKSVMSASLPGNTGKRFGAPAIKSENSGNTYTVTNLTDLDDGVCDSDCSLREAIYAANDSAGADTINFNVSGIIELEITLPYILDPAGLTIDGTGQTISISGTYSNQVFFVSSDSSLTLNNITLSNGFIYSLGRLLSTNTTFNNAIYNPISLKPSDSSLISSNIKNSLADDEPIRCYISIVKRLLQSRMIR